MGEWNFWKNAIIKVAELEAKRAPIKKLLLSYREIPEGISYENGKTAYQKFLLSDKIKCLQCS